VNKKEFIDAIASQHEPLPRAQAARIVDSEFVTIGSEIKRGRKVQVTGFGTFLDGEAQDAQGLPSEDPGADQDQGQDCGEVQCRCRTQGVARQEEGLMPASGHADR